MRNNKGFTLVELIVSVALLAIILVPVSQFFIDSFRVQAQSQTKSAVTRVGQYIVENFKNKNYLEFDFSEIKVKYDAENKPLNEFADGVERSYTKKVTYGNLEYDVTVEFDKEPMVNDVKTSSVPDFFDYKVNINEEGTISVVNAIEMGSKIVVKNKNETFTNNGKNYTANKPTIILNDIAGDDGVSYSMLIENKFVNSLNIGIVKNFENTFKIYVKGKQLYFGDGAPGDGRTAKMARFESVNISESSSNSSEGLGEMLLHANIIVTDLRDTTVSKSFSVTFPKDLE